MKMRSIFGLFTMLICLQACIKLPVYSAKYKNELNTESQRMHGYDTNSKISWAVYQENGLFELKLKTSEQASILKMLKSGTKIYFDPENKKSRKNYLHYPMKSEAKKKASLNGNESLVRQKSKGKSDRFQKMLHHLNSRMIFKQGKKTEVFDYGQDNGEIEVKHYLEQDGTFNYILRIPIKKLLGDMENTGSFSLGIVSEGLEPNPNMANPGGNMRPGGNNAMSPLPGGRSGRMQGNRPSMTTLSNAIQIWFKVDLNNPQTTSNEL